MTDAELEQRAQAYVAGRYAGKACGVRKLVLTEPSGLYYAVTPILTDEDLRHHPLTRPGILGDAGFFISHETGEIEQLPPVLSTDLRVVKRLRVPDATAKLVVAIAKGLARVNP